MDHKHEVDPLLIGNTPDTNHLVLTGVIAEDPRYIEAWEHEWCTSTIAVVGEFIPSPSEADRRQTYLFKIIAWGKAAEDLRARRRGDRVRLFGSMDYVVGADPLFRDRWQVAIRVSLVEDFQSWHGVLMHTLSKRQGQVLAWILDGMTTEEIAVTLGIALTTAKMHRDALYSKTGSLDVVDLVRWAAERGMIPIREARRRRQAVPRQPNRGGSPVPL